MNEKKKMLEEEESKFRRIQEERNRAISLKNKAAEWIQAHWKGIQLCFHYSVYFLGKIERLTLGKKKKKSRKKKKS